MSADTLISLVDRIGAPFVLFLILAWIAVLAIKGPGTVFAAKAGDGFGALCRAGVDYLAQMSARIGALPEHVTREAVASREQAARAEGGLREVILREHAATREHVSEEVGKVRDRVSAAETSLERAVAGEQTADKSSSSPRGAAAGAP